MRFLSSSSSASSIASTTDSSSYIHGNVNSGGGLIGMLRRLLCFNALSTQPFDHITDFRSNREEIKDAVKGNSGIVARLMGLDSMPDVICDGNKSGSGSVTRSQSMNYADIRMKELAQAKHHRIKSTLPFREAPSFVEMETEDFFILSFEGGGEDHDLLLKSRKHDKAFRELKHRKRGKCRNKNEYDNNNGNEDENLASCDINGRKVQDSSKIIRSSSNLSQNSDVAVEVMKQPEPICQRHSCERRQSKLKTKENYSLVQKVELQNENDFENSSPVSVFDYGDSPPEPELPSSGEYLGLANSSFRRRLSGELEIYHDSSSIIKSNLTNNDEKADKSEARRLHSLQNNGREFQNYAEMWAEICKLVKTEKMESDSTYREPRKLEDYKDIGVAISFEILDNLISEFLELLTSNQKKHIWHIPDV